MTKAGIGKIAKRGGLNVLANVLEKSRFVINSGAHAFKIPLT
jgi:2-oxoglutarate dehydrogenase complex dehydrogenase (E1) component-like enzyme